MKQSTEPSYKMCTRCVMDTSDPGISFDTEGVCNYCLKAEALLPSYRFSLENERLNLDKMAQTIKSRPGKSGYDCILGLSGGVDSSYVALLAKEMGVKPLCVHFDNGWNTDVAVANIHTIVEYCKFELFTYVINWEEFRDLQRSFIQAGVVDLEMLSDHAIFASLFNLRRKYGIKYVLSGTNFATEYGLPDAWIWSKMDWTNIKSIHRKYGTIKLKTFPSLPTLKWLLIRQFGIGGTFLEPLNKINYSKSMAIKKLEAIGWKNYGGKHYESLITKFYQAYILPYKFGIDKRRFHHSALIRNGELTRSEALMDIATSPMSNDEVAREKNYVAKKLGFSVDEFDRYMSLPPQRHDQYDTDQRLIKTIATIVKWLRKISSTSA